MDNENVLMSEKYSQYTEYKVEEEIDANEFKVDIHLVLQIGFRHSMIHLRKIVVY